MNITTTTNVLPQHAILYKSLAYFVCSIIILSNSIVVISSGLLIRKGQYPRSTYLLLGNVSLADTIIGATIILHVSGIVTDSSKTLCLCQIGVVVLPTQVSVMSVGLITIDRYVYILHGLYYKRWISTSRVRIAIFSIWIIGLVMGFIPAATGWISDDYTHECFYLSLFPRELILINCLISILVLLTVSLLYCIILIHALENIRSLKKANFVYKAEIKNNHIATLDSNCKGLKECTTIQELNVCKIDSMKNKSIPNNKIMQHRSIKLEKEIRFSRISIYTLESSENIKSFNKDENCDKISRNLNSKCNQPSEWRAVKVITLTSFTFLVTLMPFFFVECYYILCKYKHNSECEYLRSYLRGPLGMLAYTNSALNPLIYAWWHRGFTSFFKQNFLRTYNNIKKNKCTIVTKNIINFIKSK